MQEVARRLGASGIDNLQRAAAQRRHPKAAASSIVRRQRNGTPSALLAAQKQAKLARNAALRTYVEERLAGVVVAPSGAPVPGPVVSWKSRRHGPRKHPRWANAWSPEQIARVACRWTSRTTRPCASAMKPSIKRCSFKVEARCAAN